MAIFKQLYNILPVSALEAFVNFVVHTCNLYMTCHPNGRFAFLAAFCKSSSFLDATFSTGFITFYLHFPIF